MEMIQQQHYPAERHTVRTRDGYILTVYRIPKVDYYQRNNRKVILLMHGMDFVVFFFLALATNEMDLFKNKNVKLLQLFQRNRTVIFISNVNKN